MSYMNILYAFLAKCKIFSRLGNIYCIYHYYPLSSQILSYVNIFNINGKLLLQAVTWI